MTKLLGLILALLLTASIGGLILMLIWNIVIVGFVFSTAPTITFIQAAILYLVLKMLF